MPFLNHEFTIHDLSEDIDVPVYQLSPIINQHFKSNFNSWVNRYRVNHFVSVCNLPENINLTLDALSRKSGFSNRTTFTNAFKKEKNQTPGIFLKQQAQNNSNLKNL
jgi:AraC-like DNA-binding protein